MFIVCENFCISNMKNFMIEEDQKLDYMQEFCGILLNKLTLKDDFEEKKLNVKELTLIMKSLIKVYN